MRQPGPRTLIPDEVLLKTSGVSIPVKYHPIMTALVSAIAEDFMEPMPASGAPDVISAATEAQTTLKVLEAAGLRAVPADALDVIRHFVAEQPGTAFADAPGRVQAAFDSLLLRS